MSLTNAFIREKPISKCQSQALGEEPTVQAFESLAGEYTPQSTPQMWTILQRDGPDRLELWAAAEEHMFKLVAAKLERGYTRQRPAQPLPNQPFLEVGSASPCPSCATSLKVPERCEQLQCYKCDYGVVVASEVWLKVAADGERCETTHALT